MRDVPVVNTTPMIPTRTLALHTAFHASEEPGSPDGLVPSGLFCVCSLVIGANQA